MTTNVTTGNLGINVLGHEEYDMIQSKLNSELYIVKEDNSDTDNSISSRTYADVGREAVHYGNSTPTSEYAKIWIDTSEDPILIEPASINMDNISTTGKGNIQSLIAPNLSAGSALALSVSGTYTLPNNGWIYINVSTSSEIKLLNSTSTGNILTHIKTNTNISSDKLFLKKGDKIYTSILSGTVNVTYYPCRSS
jgi:hypothetical protein